MLAPTLLKIITKPPKHLLCKEHMGYGVAQQEQLEIIRAGHGFIAALDQSGGSTPKALTAYGVSTDDYIDDEQMYDQIHEMRMRIVCAPDFTGNKVIGVILFENTMDRTICGLPIPKYLWEDRGVVPFLKVDKGLLPLSDGVQLMKPISNLEVLLKRASDLGVFGTKMRSLINEANPQGIQKIIAQQFDLAAKISNHGLMPIIEPEISINISDKTDAEDMLKATLNEALDALPVDQYVMLKLTLPENANHYRTIVEHPNVLSTVALSGGYDRKEANSRLAQNSGMIASFSRALTEGLSAHQNTASFNAVLSETINSIFQASISD